MADHPYGRKRIEGFDDGGGIIFWPGQSVLWGKPARTGGTSIMQTMVKQFGEPVTFKTKPDTYRDLIAAIYVEEWRRRLVTIRNPFGRFVSLWRYFAPGVTLDEFITLFDGLLTGRKFEQHARPFSDYIMEVNPTDVVRLENVEADLATFLGVESVAVPHVNKTEPATCVFEWARAVEFVHERYAADVEIYRNWGEE